MQKINTETKELVLNLTQWLTRMQTSFIPLEDPRYDSFLTFDPDKKIIYSKVFSKNVSIQLDIGNATLQFREDGNPTNHLIEADDRTPAEIEAWILAELLHRGISRNKFSKKLPYKVANQNIGDSDPYKVKDLISGLIIYAKQLSLGGFALKIIASYFKANDHISLWPDTGLLEIVFYHKNHSNQQKKYCCNFSLGNSRLNEPHFFLKQIVPEKNPFVPLGKTIALPANKSNLSGKASIKKFLLDKILDELTLIIAD